MEKSLQKLTLTDRRKLEVGGVLEIISYDDENITMYNCARQSAYRRRES